MNNTESELNDVNTAKWTEVSTKLLIQFYKQNKMLVEQGKLKTMKKMWEVVKTGMNENGYSFSATQCENKWKSLDRSFKLMIQNNNETGRSRKSCPYEKELSDILLESASIIPPVVMDATTVASKLFCSMTEPFFVEVLTYSQEENLEMVDDDLLSSTSEPSRLETHATPLIEMVTASPLEEKIRNRFVSMNGIQQLHEAIRESNEIKRIAEEKKAIYNQNVLLELNRGNDLLEQLLLQQLHEAIRERNEIKRIAEEKKAIHNQNVLLELKRHNGLLEQLLLNNK